MYILLQIVIHYNNNNFMTADNFDKYKNINNISRKKITYPK